MAIWGNIISTLILLVALVGGYLAWKNIGVLKEQNRRNTFRFLMQDITNTDATKNRDILHALNRIVIREFPELIKDRIHSKRIAHFFIATGQGLNVWKEDELNIGKLRNIWCLLRDEFYPNNDAIAEQKFREAFEETIALFDRVGYFITRGEDLTLINEAPLWIWDTVLGMWNYLSEYIEARQNYDRKHYGFYFKELAEITKYKQQTED